VSAHIPDDQQRLATGDVDDESNVTSKVVLQAVLDKNRVGAVAYLKNYDRFKYLIPARGKPSEAQDELDAFLAQDRLLEDVVKYIERLTEIKRIIGCLRTNVPLNFFCLNGTKLHHWLATETQRLIDMLITNVANKSRDHNESICSTFREIMLTLKKKPTNSEEMVALETFLEETRQKTTYAMDKKIVLTKEHVRFMMKYAMLSQEDVRLNTQTVRWPMKLEPFFETAEENVEHNRKAGTDALTLRVEAFEKLLDDYLYEVDVYTEKAELLRSDTIRHNVNHLEKMVENIGLAHDEAAGIADEEKHLEFDPSNFNPQIQLIESTMAPYLTLWRTAKSWFDNHHTWLNGPFPELNGELIAEEVNTMYRTAFKLSKQLADRRGPMKTTSSLMRKVVGCSGW